MAKTSAVQKNLKRIKLVKKFANKRTALKKIINNKKLELSETNHKKIIQYCKKKKIIFL